MYFRFVDDVTFSYNDEPDSAVMLPQRPCCNVVHMSRLATMLPYSYINHHSQSVNQSINQSINQSQTTLVYHSRQIVSSDTLPGLRRRLSSSKMVVKNRKKATDAAGAVACARHRSGDAAVASCRHGAHYGGEEEKEGDGGVNDALVGDVDVGQLLVHRFVERDHSHNVDVRYEPEQT